MGSTAPIKIDAIEDIVSFRYEIRWIQLYSSLCSVKYRHLSQNQRKIDHIKQISAAGYVSFCRWVLSPRFIILRKMI